MNKKTLKVAVLCGGPSLERGISLNSARSVLDHLSGPDIVIIPIYFDYKKQPYKISPAQLYSNTPSDFDFKLAQLATPLSPTGLIRALKQVDLAFPVMHGAFGEDGTIQRLLEKHAIPYVGSNSASCTQMFDKFRANEFISQHGFYAAPSALLKIYHHDHQQIIRDFFKQHNIKRAIVKPAAGGSSIGVFSVNSVDEALEKAQYIFSKRMDTRVVLEPFITGTEFTVVLLQNRFGLPIALFPTEIETDYTENQIFDFRKKYLPSRHVTYHCPPRFSNQVIEQIQVQAEQLFALFGIHDFARFDGWVLPDGKLWFSDFNPISGMEQNSFLFQQAARVGFSHSDVLRYIVKNACRRLEITFPSTTKLPQIKKQKPVQVLFGGNTSERQVSLMSGTNVWLKLRKSNQYIPQPFLLDLDHNVWQLPYALTLNHTIEEILANCQTAAKDEARIGTLEQKAQLRLALQPGEASEQFFLPHKTTLSQFVKESNFVFIALHGGIGEDGTLQQLLTSQHKLFNGANTKVSKLCMDKWLTARAIERLNIDDVTVAPQASLPLKQLEKYSLTELNQLWKKLCSDWQTKSVIVKPQADGCSSGIVRLYSVHDLQAYLKIAERGIQFIKPNTLSHQPNLVDMPQETIKDLLFEKFIITDQLAVKNNELKYTFNTGWVEITAGVLEINHKLHVLNPSITIAAGEVLTVEEKFQGGTGVNITPPPTSLVKPAALKKAKRLISEVATGLGIAGYSRIDAFLQIKTGAINIIEVNTLPGLTPATVLYHQGLSEPSPLLPRALLEKIIVAGKY